MGGSQTLTMRVAAAQIGPILGDVAGNVEKHLEWIARARDENVELLVFPELSLTGYDVGRRAHELGIELTDRPRDTALGRIAEAAGDMYVIVGFVEEGFGAQYFNSAALVRGGKLLFVHRKVNLANYGDMQEAKFFAAGRYIEAFELASRFTGALMLCSDMWNPPLVHIAALHGATLLTVPTNSSLDAASGDVSKPERWDLVLKFYSSLYGLPIVFANRIGSEGVHTFWGGSRILDPFGNVVAEARGEEESLVTAELDYADVRLARYRLPTVRDSNLGLIHREIERLAHRVGVPTLVRPS